MIIAFKPMMNALLLLMVLGGIALGVWAFAFPKIGNAQAACGTGTYWNGSSCAKCALPGEFVIGPTPSCSSIYGGTTVQSSSQTPKSTTNTSTTNTNVNTTANTNSGTAISMPRPPLYIMGNPGFDNYAAANATLQVMLIHMGLLDPQGVTGKYDDPTKAAIKKFQCDNGISACTSSTQAGKVTNDTKTKLQKAYNALSVVSIRPVVVPSSINPMGFGNYPGFDIVPVETIGLQFMLIHMGLLDPRGLTGEVDAPTRAAITKVYCSNDPSSSACNQPGKGIFYGTRDIFHRAYNALNGVSKIGKVSTGTNINNSGSSNTSASGMPAMPSIPSTLPTDQKGLEKILNDLLAYVSSLLDYIKKGGTTIQTPAPKPATTSGSGTSAGTPCFVVGPSSGCPPTATSAGSSGAAPTCSFTITPNVLPKGGGNVTYTWSTTNATNISAVWGTSDLMLNSGRLDNLAPSDTRTTFVSYPLNFTLTATGPGGTAKCYQTVSVASDANPNPSSPVSGNTGGNACFSLGPSLSCANNPTPTTGASCTWPGGVVYWNNGSIVGEAGAHCEAYVPQQTIQSGHGSNRIFSTLGGYNGSVGFTCNNGTFVEVSPTCSN